MPHYISRFITQATIAQERIYNITEPLQRLSITCRLDYDVSPPAHTVWLALRDISFRLRGGAISIYIEFRFLLIDISRRFFAGRRSTIRGKHFISSIMRSRWWWHMAGGVKIDTMILINFLRLDNGWYMLSFTIFLDISLYFRAGIDGLMLRLHIDLFKISAYISLPPDDIEVYLV